MKHLLVLPFLGTLALLLAVVGCDSSDDGSAGDDSICDGTASCAELCQARTSAEECSAIELPPMGGADLGQHCAWFRLVETSFDESDDCVYGEVVEFCDRYTVSEDGCNKPKYCDEAYDTSTSVIREEIGGKLYLGLAGCGPHYSGVQTCHWGNEEQPLEFNGPPECECACEPDFPLGL